MMIITMRVTMACRLWNLYENDDNMMLTMKTMPKGWDTEWHARKSCPTWTSTMGHCSDLGHCVLCVCKNLAWQAKDRSSQHHNQITISFKLYAPFNFRMFHFGSVSSLSNSLAKKLLASEFCQVHQLKHSKLFVSSRWTNNILYGAAGALHALHWTIFFWHDDWIPKNCAVDS